MESLTVNKEYTPPPYQQEGGGLRVPPPGVLEAVLEEAWKETLEILQDERLRMICSRCRERYRDCIKIRGVVLVDYLDVAFKCLLFITRCDNRDLDRDAPSLRRQP